MNTETTTTLACPSCGATNGVAMTDGTRLCLACRNEWNPADVPHLTVPVPEHTEVAEVAPEAAVPAHDPYAAEGAPLGADDVLGPPASELAARDAQAALDALVGTTVVLEGGQPAVIVEFPDDDHVTVNLAGPEAEAELVTVSYGDVVRSVDAPPPVADVDDETAVALAQVNMAVAGLVIRAGLSAIAGEYPEAQLVTPATGWLPLDVDGLPAVEQGAAYAVAFIIHAFSLDREIIGAIADTLLTDAQQQDTTKGGE